MDNQRRETLNEALKILETARMTPAEKSTASKDFEAGLTAVNELEFLHQKETEIIGIRTRTDRELYALRGEEIPGLVKKFIQGKEEDGIFSEPIFKTLRGLKQHEKALLIDIEICETVDSHLKILIENQEKLISTAMDSARWMIEREEKLEKFPVDSTGSLGSFKRILGDRYVERQ
jgi:hypothetical protein